jgi:hypothetical protein
MRSGRSHVYFDSCIPLREQKTLIEQRLRVGREVGRRRKEKKMIPPKNRSEPSPKLPFAV